ncbi:hypothetical protein EDB89DRAFT_2128071 [Lactarius sanguifluus]|nr:hypothetical protein EDB89DRAFT_2128071 [Lactarius sanguifluus]
MGHIMPARLGIHLLVQLKENEMRKRKESSKKAESEIELRRNGASGPDRGNAAAATIAHRRRLVALACHPCAHIITLAPSSWLAVHANCGCVRVGSLPPLQSSSSGVYVIGNDYNRHRVYRHRHHFPASNSMKKKSTYHPIPGTSAKEADDIVLPPPPLPSGGQPWGQRELPNDDYDTTMTTIRITEDYDNRQRQLRLTVDDSGRCQGCCGAAAGYPMATLEHIVH